METRFRRRWIVLLAALLLTVAACQGWGGTPTPAPTAGPTETPVPPTATLTPTATPLPLPAPRLLYHAPETGESQKLNAPIAMTFDQAMDADSVVAAFAITPTVDGEFAWLDARTLQFTPAKPLLRNAFYQVAVNDDARNAEGEAVQGTIGFEFQTVGYLEVGEVQPIPDAQDIAPDDAVTVVFNRPVVPLTSLEQQAALPAPLTFDPPVEGEGEWINTSIYRFRPSTGFSPSTRYEATIGGDLQDVSGATLKDAYTWEFATEGPRVMAFYPRRNAEHVPTTTTVSITFNQPMDHPSVEAGFALRVGDVQVPGTFSWTKPNTETLARDMPEVNTERFEMMVFTPDEPFSRNTRPVFELKQTAKSANGQLTLSDALKGDFRVVLDPGVLSVSPQDGQSNVDPWRDLRITFASPMQTANFMDYLTISPQATDVYTYWHDSDTEVMVSFMMSPTTKYHVTLSGDAPDRYGAPLGEGFDIRFTTGDLDPYLYLHTRGEIGIYNAYTGTVVYAEYRNIKTFNLSLYRMSPEKFLRYFARRSDEYGTFVPDPTDLVRKWTMEAAPPRNTSELRRVDLVTEAGGQLLPGIYYLSAISPEVVAAQKSSQPLTYVFVRSHLNLTFKQTAYESMLWATDLATGQPVPGLDVHFARINGAAYDEGVTGADGVYHVTGQTNIDLWDDAFAFSGEAGSATFGVVYNNWDSGVQPWNFGLDSDYSGLSYQTYMYTDRPIYRPGQTIYFKGIVRADADAHYALPEKVESLRVFVRDPQNKELYKQDLPVSDMGTFSGELVLDAEAPLGTYYVLVDDKKWFDLHASASFRVAEYRKPEFQVGVQTDKDAYLNGEPLKATVDATYYFGGPVADADVHWSLLSGAYYFSYRCPRGEKCPRYSWTDYEWEDEDQERDYGSYGHLVAEGDAASDGQGRVIISASTDISQELTSRTFTLEASVTDINDQYVSNRTATVVHKGLFYIGLAPQGRIVEAGKEKAVDVLTVDWDSEPAPNVALDVIFMEHRWYNVREEAEDGRAYWTWVVEDVPVFTTTATTDDQGKAVVTFTPPNPGNYRVRAIGKDTRGNRIQSSAYIWAWGGWANWRRDDTNRITLIPDKDEYQIGDVAEILIPSPYSGTVKALVTIERGHILTREVRELRNNSEVLKIPIVADYAPNIFVSVVIVQGSDQSSEALASFKMGVVQLPVSIEEKELHITLTPDRALDEGAYYRPRETATYDVQVTDYAGKPVAAELSLRLADLAVLALADDSGPTLMQRFWSQRGLGVRTTMPLALAMEAYNRDLSPKAKGGGGGADGFIRSNFADTAYWNPTVRTGTDGKAQVAVKLPDNLTTWRMQARGITTDTLVGVADVDILSTLDLLVRPVLPRFFVVGDQAEIATIVHNNTDKPLNAAVVLTVDGLEVQGALRQTVEVPASDKVKVIWPVTVLLGEAVKVQMTAQAGDYRDGVENTLPVYRYSTPEVMGTAGRLAQPEVRQELIQLPRSFDPTQGELTVQVDGALTSATADSLKYLEHYPYECVEQTVSRFFPNVLTYQMLKEMGVARPELETALKEQVGVALQRLYAAQNYDGGWGWWQGEPSDISLSTYVLHALLETHRAGLAVDKESMTQAVEYLRENLSLPDVQIAHWKANRQAYQLYVLAEYIELVSGARAEGELGHAINLFNARQYLDLHGRATLAMALDLLEPGEDQRVNTLLADFAGNAVQSATGTHWEESAPDYWNMNTDVRTTAVVLWAMSRRMPESDLLPNIVRWLMSVREGDMANRRYWKSTYTTSWVMMSLIEYMRASGEMQGDFSYTVTLNGEALLDGSYDKENLDESQKVQVEIARLLAEEGNRLVLERRPAQVGQTGAGQLYYTAHLRYFLPAAEVEAAERGIVVARRYERMDGSQDGPVMVGDLIQVKLTVVAPTDLYYVIVEDPLPAGCEAVDMGLKTSSVVGEAPSLRALTAEEEDYWYRRYGWGWWWFSHAEMRDEKVALFASYLPRGAYEYSYIMRASIPGTFNVIPTTASEMYFPEVWGRSDGEQFVIQPD